MSISGRDEEDLASCSTKDTYRESRKSHTHQSPSPTELVTAIPQEPFDQGLEYQEMRKVEDRGRVKRKPRHPSRSETDCNSSEEEGRYNRKRGKGRWLRRKMAAVLGVDLMEGDRQPT